MPQKKHSNEKFVCFVKSGSECLVFAYSTQEEELPIHKKTNQTKNHDKLHNNNKKKHTKKNPTKTHQKKPHATLFSRNPFHSTKAALLHNIQLYSTFFLPKQFI